MLHLTIDFSQGMVGAVVKKHYRPSKGLSLPKNQVELLKNSAQHVRVSVKVKTSLKSTLSSFLLLLVLVVVSFVGSSISSLQSEDALAT